MISNTIEKISLRKGEWEIKADIKDMSKTKSKDDAENEN
jgi:hypothetical protein